MAQDNAAARGKLVVIGGNEDRKPDLQVLGRVVDLCGGRPPVVEVLPIASGDPKHVSDEYLRAFKALNVGRVDILDARARSDAEESRLAARIRDADLLFFTGGDQLRITSVLGGSPLLEAIQDRYFEGAVVAGACASAAAMPATMIHHGEAPHGGGAKGNVQMTPGLGLIQNAIVDAHFADRGRFSRLIEAVATNPGHVGIGLSEDTGVIVHDGASLEVVGPGLVVVVDGHQVGHTNISDVRIGQPVAVENVSVHTLTEGYGYDLATLRYLPPDVERARELGKRAAT